MKKKTFLSLLFFVVLTIISFTPVFSPNNKNSLSATTPSFNPCGFINLDENEISAKRAILIEKETNLVILSKNPDEKWGMASTTKIMTALIALEENELSDLVTISKQATNIEGSSIYLEENEIFTVEDLLYGLLLESGNDVAVALAIHTKKDIESFCRLMNKKAKEIGMNNTNFSNPHGLSDENHFSTARDMGILSTYAMGNDKFREIVSTKSIQIKPKNNDKTRYLVNHNKLLWKDENIKGIKTGYTKKDGRCLVTSYNQDGIELICVTLDSPDHWNDHLKLFSKGFSEIEKRTLVTKGEYAFNVSVVGGNNSFVLSKNPFEIVLPLPKNSDIEIKSVLLPFVYAPVKEGDIVGELRIYEKKQLIYTSPICATKSISEKKVSLFRKIIHFFKD